LPIRSVEWVDLRNWEARFEVSAGDLPSRVAEVMP